jgi:predicted TPR repeat methyltransferase
MYRVRAHVVTREIRRAGIDLGARAVLDVGSGTGFYIQLWQDLGARKITGSDFAPFAVHALEKKYPAHRFVELDVSSEQLSPADEKYDLVSAFDIFYHIVDDKAYARAFRNVRSLLNVGGYFVFSENFLPREREVGLHQVSRSNLEIAALLAENKFEIVSRAPVFVLMNRPLDSSRRVLGFTWRLIERVARMRDHPRFGGWLGAALYPLELLCVRLAITGPTTEMMVCRLSE